VFQRIRVRRSAFSSSSTGRSCRPDGDRVDRVSYLDAPTLTAMLRRIIANNRAGG